MSDSDSPCSDKNAGTMEPQSDFGADAPIADARPSDLADRSVASSAEFKEADDGDDSAYISQEQAKEAARGVEVVDDFIRNFCARNGMLGTLQQFEEEWHDLLDQGFLNADRERDVPNQYVLNSRLEESIDRLQKQIGGLQVQLETEKRNAVTIKRERDAHRLHHKRIAQEKNTLTDEIKRLRAENEAHAPRLQDLQRKYETQLKEKSLIAHEKEKLHRKLIDMEKERRPADLEKEAKETPHKISRRRSQSSFLLDRPREPTEKHERLDLSILDTSRMFEGHSLAVSNLALHPHKAMAVSVSDDQTWKLWRLTDRELLMTGTGHTDWISGVDFHPEGNGIVTGSGDGSVKLWDFRKEKCVATFHENQAVWSVHYHQSGDAIATASLDHVARIWDLHSERCRTVFRGHSDSVNEVVWHPWTATLAAASSDKTVSLWDARTSQSWATLPGHTNACNHCCYAPDGQTIVSCDADGVTKVWDPRTLRQRLSISAPQCATNKCIFDKSGQVFVVANSDGYVRSYEAVNGHEQHAFLAHEGGTLCAKCDLSNSGLVTSGSDHCLKYWLYSSGGHSAADGRRIEPFKE